MSHKQHKEEPLLWFIAERIKELRKEKDITQEHFLFDTGIHIGRIERAGRNFSVSTLLVICQYLDISLSDFFNTSKFTELNLTK